MGELQVKKPITLEEKRARIIEIHGEKDRLDTEERTLTREMQKECRHESVVESSIGLPHRVCIFCGLEENSSSSFKALKDSRVVKVVGDELCKYRRLLPLTMALVLEEK